MRQHRRMVGMQRRVVLVDAHNRQRHPNRHPQPAQVGGVLAGTMQQPFGEQVEYEVPDNWWHSKDYYNVPLDTFMKILKSAVRKGYTMSIGGDVSEPGKDAEKKVCMIPDFDIPSQYIDDNARQLRFSNHTTTDDHGIHLIGYMEKDGKDWYLIKDSGSSAYNADPKGYYFFTEDYVKLKMMDFMVHKDAVKGFIDVN